MTSVAEADLFIPPPVPATVIVRVRGCVAFELTVAVRIEVQLGPVTVVGLRLRVIPVRAPLAVKETLELNPPDGVMVTM
jgi:hypothetical protein